MSYLDISIWIICHSKKCRYRILDNSYTHKELFWIHDSCQIDSVQSTNRHCVLSRVISRFVRFEFRSPIETRAIWLHCQNVPAVATKSSHCGKNRDSGNSSIARRAFDRRTKRFETLGAGVHMRSSSGVEGGVKRFKSHEKLSGALSIINRSTMVLEYPPSAFTYSQSIRK